ncbi:MAG: hypothetical protein H0X07_04140 [Gemmatimonadales bacterium]|nr:hypothetical protein [Gemmatimonadales bacterium]
MITILAFRHLLVRKLRSLFLLLGFSLGVGVMIVLLSVGEAMLDQSRDVSLVGGGEVTVLPQGIDVEAMRTGGMGGMFFGIDRARFLTRQILGGPRQNDLVQTVSPVIEGKLVYLRHGNRTVAVRAGAEIPSRAYAVGSGLDLQSGRWSDSPADSDYVAPTAHRLYNELDRFHLPPRPDSTWGEWHYFNLVTAPDEWWYITYLVGGEVPTGRWGGQLLITRRHSGGRHERFSLQVPSSQVEIDTSAADLTIGGNTVRQRDGIYRLKARVPGRPEEVRIDVELAPTPNRYFPPVELREDDFLSGYVVPALEAKASGRICVGGRCNNFTGVPAYHDHNWGVWRDVTWEWGAARGTRLSVLYGGVYGPDRDRAGTGSRVNSPFFLTLADSLGVKQVLRFTGIDYQGAQAVPGSGRITAPARFTLVGTREADTVRIDVQVGDVLATEMRASKLRRTFLQMRGRFSLAGRVSGAVVADSGTGFFETYVPIP